MRVLADICRICGLPTIIVRNWVSGVDMTLRLFILSFTLFTSSCISYQPHVWTRSQPREPSIQQLSIEKLAGVSAEELPQAIQLLEHAEYVLLDDTSVKRFAKHRIHKSAGENIFLVRGVSWSRPPLFREVYFDETTRTIYVDSYTYNGEIFIPGKRYSEPSPIIVCITFTPSAVFPTAIIGGDRIAGRSFHKEAWRE